MTNSYSIARTKSKSELEQAIANRQAASVAALNVLEADCIVQNLTVGSVIRVRSAKWKGRKDFDIKSYGEYMIIAIEHRATGSTTYECRFKAIPSGVAKLPEPDVPLPKASAQVAKVISNADPKGKGRIKVQLLWQKHQDTTNWIRVMTPDAGSSGHHAQNRGHVFIPEEGDEVMVGFRYSDPNRPFVMGSLFHGANGAGGKELNTHKSIITRSGHVLEFNDTDNRESITLTDKKGNQIIIDTYEETITINALKDININAGRDINVTAGENINVSAGNDISENADNNISSTAGNDMALTATRNMIEMSDNRKDLVEEDFSRQSTTSDEFADEVTMFSAKENMTIQSSKTVDIKSAEKSKLF